MVQNQQLYRSTVKEARSHLLVFLQTSQKSREGRAQLLASSRSAEPASPALQARSPGEDRHRGASWKAPSWPPTAPFLSPCDGGKTKSEQKETPREEARFGAEYESQKGMENEERLCIPPVENIRACAQSEMSLLDRQQPFLFS